MVSAVRAATDGRCERCHGLILAGSWLYRLAEGRRVVCGSCAGQKRRRRARYRKQADR